MYVPVNTAVWIYRIQVCQWEETPNRTIFGYEISILNVFFSAVDILCGHNHSRTIEYVGRVQCLPVSFNGNWHLYAE